MTQDEIWLSKYKEVVGFIETNHRPPSMHSPEERYKYGNWLKYNRKMLNTGEMKDDRKELFVKLLDLSKKYRHVNQYQ